MQYPIRKAASVRSLLREACWARNVSRTYGGKTPIELALGRRPPDIVTLENANPAKLTGKPLEADEIVNRIRMLALNSYLKARQSEDVRNDLAGSLRFTGGPFHPGDKVWYYSLDENKLKRGKKYGRWWKATVVQVNRSMVIIDFGGRILTVISPYLERTTICLAILKSPFLLTIQRNLFQTHPLVLDRPYGNPCPMAPLTFWSYSQAQRG